jgi:hypothetical protein
LSRSGKSFESFGRGVINAIEDHGELGGSQFDFGVVRSGKMVTPHFQSLTPKAQSVSTPVENLEPIGLSVGEEEKMSTARIGLERATNITEQAIKAEA